MRIPPQRVCSKGQGPWQRRFFSWSLSARISQLNGSLACLLNQHRWDRPIPMRCDSSSSSLDQPIRGSGSNNQHLKLHPEAKQQPIWLTEQQRNMGSPRTAQIATFCTNCSFRMHVKGSPQVKYISTGGTFFSWCFC